MAITYVDSPDRVRAALSPVRRDLLKRLRTPSSASRLAAGLELPGQRLNYHLKALEKAGLVELGAERPRRGCVERILRTRPGALVVDPAVVTGEFTKVHDQYAAEHLVGAATATAAGLYAPSSARISGGSGWLWTVGLSGRGLGTDRCAGVSHTPVGQRLLLGRHAASSPASAPAVRCNRHCVATHDDSRRSARFTAPPGYVW